MLKTEAEYYQLRDATLQGYGKRLFSVLDQRMGTGAVKTIEANSEPYC